MAGDGDVVELEGRVEGMLGYGKINHLTWLDEDEDGRSVSPLDGPSGKVGGRSELHLPLEPLSFPFLFEWLDGQCGRVVVIRWLCVYLSIYARGTQALSFLLLPSLLRVGVVGREGEFV